MQNTCSGKECPLWKKYKKSCPNFIETGWKEHDNAQPVMISDCAPKRTLLMMQTLYNRFIGVQKSSEKQINTTTKFMGVLDSVFERFQALAPPDKTKAIEADFKEIEDDVA